MERDIMNRLQCFQLSAKQVEGVQIEENDIASSKEVCGRSLARKIYGEKRVSSVRLKNTMIAMVDK